MNPTYLLDTNVVSRDKAFTHIPEQLLSIEIW